LPTLAEEAEKEGEDGTNKWSRYYVAESSLAYNPMSKHLKRNEYHKEL